jgi:Chromosome segregation ATPases
MTQRSHASDQGETQQLRAANEQLKMELNEVRAQLHASEAQLQGSAEIQHDSSRQEIARTHAEVGALREQLNDSQAKIRELENARQNQVDIDALEARHRQERQSLGARVAELERETSAGREKLQELETLRAHMAESEQSQRSLREEIQHHEQEAARWQARIAEADANREQLGRAAKTLQRVTFQTCIAGRNAARAPAGFIVSRSVDGRTSPTPPPRPACLMLRVRRRRERARLGLNSPSKLPRGRKQNQKKRGALAFFPRSFVSGHWGIRRMVPLSRTPLHR